MALPAKIKKVFLLILLLLVSFVLSVVKFVSGGKSSNAQAQCWAPSGTTDAGTTDGYPAACITTGTTDSTTEAGCY